MKIGIDLGTTNTVAGWMNIYGNIEFLEFDDGRTFLPSCVFFDRGKVIVGSEAEVRASEDPSSFVCQSKIYMDDRKKTWEKEGRRYRAEDIAFEILKKVRMTLSERFPDEKKFDAVVTVPAKFGEDQIRRTASALKRAGIGMIEIIKEPVAAALAFNDDSFRPGDTVYVIDFGGGTVDAALVELTGRSGVTGFVVSVADGNRHLGGRDLDRVISSLLLEQLRDCSGQDLTDEEAVFGAARKKTRRVIEEASEKLKKMLYASPSERAVMDLDEVCAVCEKRENCSRGGHFRADIGYDEYLSAADEIYEKLTSLIVSDEVMERKIDHVIFVGGMSADPYLKQFIASTFEGSTFVSASDVCTGDSCLTVIARGAAIKACDENIHIVNKLLNSLGMICTGRNGKYMDPVIPAGTDVDDDFEVRHVYTNTGRFETELRFEVYEYSGDPEDFGNLEYRKAGEFVFNDINPMDTGKQKIETVFRFDSQGVLTVTAEDLNDHNRSIEVSFEI
ncbi:Hsp70 family protein [Ruminococcus sp. HUN007]|uniref:Hsp70 family protein n=1 Tax=Ruminococcus sp. HUN007 TaxID=1514668 RepID=UPI0005D2624E|nr:Hsp70 family protein [Ruminococcus sp. HUN007]